MRAITSGERTTLGSDHFVIYEWLEVQDASGAWVDVTNLLGGSWLLSTTLDLDLDNIVGTAEFTLALSATVPGVGDVSLSPLAGSSPANNGGPLFDYERAIRYKTATLLPTDPAPAIGSASVRTVFLGKITDFNESGTELRISALDEASREGDAWFREEKEYSTDEGTPVETVMEAMRTDVAPWLPALVTPVSPGWMIKKFRQEKASLLAARREKLALQIGWDFRYRWTGPHTFQPVFQSPDRFAPTVQATFNNTEYTVVGSVGGTGNEIINVADVRYYDTDAGEVKTEQRTNATSVARFGGAGRGERWAEIALGEGSNIDTVTEAGDLALSLVTDMGEPPVAIEIETLYFWPAEIGDYYLFGPNDDHWNVGQALAVVHVTHEIARGHGKTTFRVRGKPAAAYRTWRDVYGSGVDRGVGVELTLVNFRDTRRTTTEVDLEWDDIQPSEAACDEIWRFESLAAMPVAADPWPTATSTPIERLTPSTRLVTAQIPPVGQVRYLSLLPVDKDKKPGHREDIRIFNALEPPRFGKFSYTRNVTATAVNVTLEVFDPQALGGTLSVWCNHDAPASADATAAPDGTLPVVSTPVVVGPSDVWTTGMGARALLQLVRVDAGKGKTLFFEFVNSQGTSTGVVAFEVGPGNPIIDAATGDIIDEGIKRATQFGGTTRPVLVLPWPLPIPNEYPIGQVAVVFQPDDADHNRRIYQWDGAAWNDMTTFERLDGELLRSQIADRLIQTQHVDLRAINEDLLALGAVTSQILGAGAIQPVHVSFAAIGPDALAAGAVQTTHITDDAITTPKVRASNIIGVHLAGLTITGDKIVGDTITGNKIAALTIAGDRIAANTLTGDKIVGLTITGDKIVGLTITGAKIQGLSITGDKIAGTTITGDKIAGLTITGDKIFGLTITGDKIAGNTITGNKIKALEITSDLLASKAVIAGKIEVGAINAADLIVNGVITAVKLNVSVLSEVTSHMGIIVHGRLNAALTGTFLDLDAAGGLPILYSPQIQINSDGSASFNTIRAGMIYSPDNVGWYLNLRSGATTLIALPGLTVGVASTVFSGTVASSSFTAPMATFLNITAGVLTVATVDAGTRLSVQDVFIATGESNIDRIGFFGSAGVTKRTITGATLDDVVRSIRAALRGAGGYNLVDDVSTWV